MQDDELLFRLQQTVGNDLVVLNPVNDETVYALPVEKWLAVTALLIEEWGSAHLSAITAQQREELKGQIEVMYHFWHSRGITFKLTLPVDQPEIPSVIELIPGADFYEREAAEMFGISFTGREATPHLLLPDDWDKAPPFTEKAIYE